VKASDECLFEFRLLFLRNRDQDTRVHTVASLESLKALTSQSIGKWEMGAHSIRLSLPPTLERVTRPCISTAGALQSSCSATTSRSSRLRRPTILQVKQGGLTVKRVAPLLVERLKTPGEVSFEYRERKISNVAAPFIGHSHVKNTLFGPLLNSLQ
jgi:hypothetical protein